MLKKILIELKWISFVIVRRVKSRLSLIKRLFIRPQLPINQDKKILIHLGCGDINSPEFINVDTRPAPHIHYVCNVTDLSIFNDNYADMVYACHILEHIPHSSLKKTLWEWRRILKPNGTLRLSVPDFDRILQVYHSCNNDIASIVNPLMGGQDYKYNIHHSVYNKKYLEYHLREAGFKQVCQWNPNTAAYHNFEDWASKCYDVDGRQYEISLNIEAIK